MVLKKENMSTVVRSRLKGGKGDISFLNFADCTDFRDCCLYLTTILLKWRGEDVEAK